MTSLGITLTTFEKENANPYVHRRIYMDHFFSRKWLLVRYSIGFIVFPGGYGTLDELFEIITLEQTERMPKIPIVLMDTEYWAPIMDWIKNKAHKAGLIEDADLNLITVTDDVQKAADIIIEYCKHYPEMERPLYTR